VPGNDHGKPCHSAASWVEKLGGAGSCNFPTEEIIGGQNGGFSASNFAFLDENFSTRSFDNFPTVENLGKWQVLICSKF